jgi:DNA-binding FadR family transcriptional regulator
VPGAVAAALEGHRRVFEAVARRDPDAAARAMEDHLAEVAALIRRAMEGRHG